MDTEQQNQKIGKKDPSRAFLYRIVEETRQHAKQICQKAAIAQERAQRIVGVSRLVQQMRKADKAKIVF